MGLQIPYGLYPPKARPEVSLSSMIDLLEGRSTFEVARQFGGQELNFAWSLFGSGYTVGMG